MRSDPQRDHLPSFIVTHGLDAFRRLGVVLDPAGTFEGLTNGSRSWAGWGEVAHVLNALEPRLEADKTRLFADLYVSGHPVLRMLQPLGLSAQGLAELISRANAEVALLSQETTWEFKGRLLRVRVRQRSTLEPCPLWWKLWCAVFTAAPKAVGQPPLDLRTLTVEGHGLEATWEVPLARATRGPRIPSAARELLTLFLPKLFAGLDTVEEGRSSGHEHMRLHADHGLTRNEARIAIHIADGLTTRETATELGIAYQTVRTHLRNIYESLEVSSQRELTDFIVRWRDPR